MFLGPALYLYFLCAHRADSHLERPVILCILLWSVFVPDLPVFRPLLSDRLSHLR